jgi:hypothetical protein
MNRVQGEGAVRRIADAQYPNQPFRKETFVVFFQDAKMPLLSTHEPMELIDTSPWSVGVWMQIGGIRKATPPERIWVQSTYFCILGLDASRVVDRFSACELAETNRTRIEAAASEKFDAEGAAPEDGEREGRPVVILRARDVSDALPSFEAGPTAHAAE